VAYHRKRKFRIRLVTSAKKDIYIFFLPPVGSILIRKFLSEEGFEPPCANYDPAVLTD
jgi:hypothetical protein